MRWNSCLIDFFLLTLVVSREQSSSGVRASDDFRWPKRPLGALAENIKMRKKLKLTAKKKNN